MAQVFQNPRTGERWRVTSAYGEDCGLLHSATPARVLPCKTLNTLHLTQNKGAERGGFEPPARVLPEQLLSRQPCSATPAPLRGRKDKCARRRRKSSIIGYPGRTSPQ